MNAVDNYQKNKKDSTKEKEEQITFFICRPVHAQKSKNKAKNVTITGIDYVNINIGAFKNGPNIRQS